MRNVDNFVEKLVFLCHREYDFFCNYMRTCQKKYGAIKNAAMLALVIIVTAFCFSSPFVISAINVKNARQKVVVIDAGHGGADGGVKGTKTGVYEKEINLKTAICLGEIFKSLGFKVVYTRQNDTMREFDGVENNKKRADMFARGRIINDAKPDIVISVHQNFFSLPTRRGAQVFYAKSSDKSRLLASSVQSMLNSINAAEGGREYSPLCAQKYLLECSPYPTIIVECGFLSNFADEQNLTSYAYRQRVAFAIADGAVSFLREEHTV